MYTNVEIVQLWVPCYNKYVLVGIVEISYIHQLIVIINTYCWQIIAQTLARHREAVKSWCPEITWQLKKIKLRTRQLIWLNPLKGMRGYEPIQKGMSAALPELDVFRSAHNLDSLLELEKFLLHV